MKTELDGAYLDMASRWADLSCAERKKVGAIIVKDGQIISDGFNGTPTGFSNTCEGEDGETLKEVLHAESNALSNWGWVFPILAIDHAAARVTDGYQSYAAVSWDADHNPTQQVWVGATLTPPTAYLAPRYDSRRHDLGIWS